MKPVPEIAPEIRGLIEEIVANPRSNLRLVPRHALLPWIEGGHRASARELSSDTATRHLVAAHREAVAKLLRDAAHIAYWKAPVLSLKPTDGDGQQYDPAEREIAFGTEVDRRLRILRHTDEGVDLLRQCLTGIPPGLGHDLARASLSLVHTEIGTITLAALLKQTQPRTSLRLYERMGRQASSSSLQGFSKAGAASRLCYMGALRDAIEAYEEARDEWPGAWFCLFNLACLSNSPLRALDAANEIARLWPADSTEVEEARGLLSSWVQSMPLDVIVTARTTVAGICDRLPEVGSRIGQIYA